MIRFGLLGGKWGPAPAEAFLALGGALLGASGLLFAYTFGSGPAVVGWIEAAVFALAGAPLLAIGLRRRRNPPKLPTEPWTREQLLP